MGDVERQVAKATCASSSSDHQYSCKETTDTQLDFGGVLRRMATNLQDVGIDFTNTYPIGQLTDPKSSACFGRFQALSLSRWTGDASRNSNLFPPRKPVNTNVGSGSFVVAQSRHRAGGIYSAAAKLRISPMKFDKFSLPRATRLLGRDDRGDRSYHSV